MTASAAPRRRTLVLLAVVFLVAFAALMLTGQDNEPDSSISAIKDSFGQSRTLIAWTCYVGMASCAVLVFLGTAVRTALRSGRRSWTGDVAMLGFVVIALTIASWGVSSLAMWHAVDQGDDASIRALNYVDTSNFLPLMLGMACAMIGTGTAGLAGDTLPRWLAVVSIVLGCLAPLGPLGFVPAMLLPVWMVVVAVAIRLEPASTT
jgi:hypothetical protein